MGHYDLQFRGEYAIFERIGALESLVFISITQSSQPFFCRFAVRYSTPCAYMRYELRKVNRKKAQKLENSDKGSVEIQRRSYTAELHRRLNSEQPVV